MANHHASAYLRVFTLMMCIVFYNFAHAEPSDASDVQLLDQQCFYESRTLCSACFPEPVQCSFFKRNITFDGLEQYNEAFDRLHQHSIRVASLNKERCVVIKNVNKSGDVRDLREAICEELDIELQDCTLRNDEKFLQVLRKRLIAEDSLEGTNICPTGGEGALSRLVAKFDQPELLTLMLMRTNSQTLMIRLLSQHGIPVPSFIFQGGFILVESYEGEPLTRFYQSSLELRLKIANELINAFFSLDSGVDNFRFYLTDINPDNFVVNVMANGVTVSFVNLNNVIILDSLSEKLDPNKSAITHSRIECDVCFGYVPENLCTYKYSDINLFAVCQLLLANPTGNIDRGFLHNVDDRSELIQIGKMLHDCIYCQPPDCADRKHVLKYIQHVIHKILT